MVTSESCFITFAGVAAGAGYGVALRRWYCRAPRGFVSVNTIYKIAINSRQIETCRCCQYTGAPFSKSPSTISHLPLTMLQDCTDVLQKSHKTRKMFREWNKVVLTWFVSWPESELEAFVAARVFVVVAHTRCHRRAPRGVIPELAIWTKYAKH